MPENLANNSANLRPVAMHARCVFLCFSDKTLKAVGPFYLSMPGSGEVKDPTQGVRRTTLSATPVLAQTWDVWSTFLTALSPWACH